MSIARVDTRSNGWILSILLGMVIAVYSLFEGSRVIGSQHVEQQEQFLIVSQRILWLDNNIPGEPVKQPFPNEVMHALHVPSSSSPCWKYVEKPFFEQPALSGRWVYLKNYSYNQSNTVRI